ncbi:hypothetical protein Tco_0195667 [Tanacetum coccineum]
MTSYDARLSKFKADFKQQQSKMTNKIDIVLKTITDLIEGALPTDTVKNPKLSAYLVLSARSYPTKDPQCSTQIHCSINAITIRPKQQSASYDDREKENEEEEKDNLLVPQSSNTENDDSREEGPKEEGSTTIEGIMRSKLDPREDANRGVSNFIGRIKGMHVFIGNFTYVIDFMIVEDISSFIDPRLSQVVLGRPFVEMSNMTHDSPE